MKLQYKSQNLEIYRNKKIDRYLKKGILKGFNKNCVLFNKTSKKIKVFICDTEKEFKKNSKYFYFSHGAGTCLRTGEVIIRSNDLIKEKFGFKMDEIHYIDFLAHEINHSFWYAFYKIQNPVWICEALATIIQGRLYYGLEGDLLNLEKTKEFIQKNNWDFSCLKYRYLKKDFDSSEKINGFYSVWGHFAEFISDKNPKKIIRFMEDLSKKPFKNNHGKLFKKHFGDSIKNKFYEFIKTK